MNILNDRQLKSRASSVRARFALILTCELGTPVKAPDLEPGPPERLRGAGEPSSVDERAGSGDERDPGSVGQTRGCASRVHVEAPLRVADAVRPQPGERENLFSKGRSSL